jgi:hypothetical protein
MNWLYNDTELSDEDIPTEAVGFVYKIIHVPTNKFYIGKKSLISTRRIKLGKKELTNLKEERKLNGISGRLPSKKNVVKESDWKGYFSSSDWIKGEVKMGRASDFIREIIKFCPTKKSLSYWEVYYQFKYDVLTNEQSLNDNIGGRYYRKDL